MAIRPTFNLKHFEQLAASMMNLLASVQDVITDYNVGSVNRTMLEAVAMELEELYYRTYQGILDGIPAGVYEDFGFGQIPATPAVGNVTFSRSTPAVATYTIPAGTIVSTASGIRFQTTEDATILIGNTSVGAQVSAVTPGEDGNVDGGSIVLMTTAVLGVETVTNDAPTAGGADVETADAQKARFAEFIVSLARSPINGIEAGAKTVRLTDSTGLIIEQVVLAKVVEPYLLDSTEPIGIASLYIDNGSGGASTDLVTKTQQVIDGYIDEHGVAIMGYRAAGVVINVIAVTLFSQAVTALVTLDPGADQDTVDTSLRNAIAAVFNGINISSGLDWPTLLSAMMVVAGVKTVSLTVPSASVGGQLGKRLRPGTITLTYQ